MFFCSYNERFYLLVCWLVCELSFKIKIQSQTKSKWFAFYSHAYPWFCALGIDCIVIWYKLEESQMVGGVKKHEVFLTSAKKEFQRWSKLILFDLALQQHFVFEIMRTKEFCAKSPKATIKRVSRASYYFYFLMLTECLILDLLKFNRSTPETLKNIFYFYQGVFFYFKGKCKYFRPF